MWGKHEGKQASEMLWTSTDPRAKQSMAGAATSPGDFPHRDALGRAGITAGGGDA